MKNVEDLRYKRTLFVGLGGAGIKTLRVLKKKIESANDGKVPEQVKFLLIDTNATELSNFRDFDNSEKICIAVREPYQRYMHDKNKVTHEYIPAQNAHSLLALERGAGQIRSNGHFAIIESQYSNKLMRIFREKADALENIDVKASTLERDPKIEIRLVFSIAGGTGSGTFLPIATLLRAAIKHSELTAYIYSATHFSKQVENSAKYSVMQNAYAALCELDYMMHFGRDEKRHQNITYNFGPEKNQQIEQSNRPFEEVYYIDKLTSFPTADSVEFAYNDLDRLRDNTAEAMHIAATNIITAHTGTVDNVRQKIMEGQFDVSDKFAWVSGFGIAELYLNTLNTSDPVAINTCCEAISARTDINKSISAEDVDRIATNFIAKKWDESNGDEDGDPILSRFVRKDIIESQCSDEVYRRNDDDASYESIPLRLSGILTKQNKNAETIIRNSSAEFESNIESLLRSLINEDLYEGHYVSGYDGKGPGMSFNMIKQILKSIEEKLELSLSQLRVEKTKHENDRKIANDKLRKAHQNNVPGVKKQSFLGKLFRQNNNTDQKEKETSETLSALYKQHQKEALINHILSERDACAIEIFDKCKAIVSEANKLLERWRELLKSAQDDGEKRKDKISRRDEKSEIKENRVEVRMLDVQKGFRLKYDDIKGLSKLASENKIQSEQAKFEAVCKLLTAASGSLKDYLDAGIGEMNTLSLDGRIKVERTECQQKIDRLIDLSTPTMQVDGHGYGEQVKVDHFWYVMTECPEANLIKKDDGDGDSKSKSVGRLLKDMVEQNVLDAKVNLVHVPGWENKAIIYRVDSAVPAYFVDGVCVSTEGGYTLEGCYEELKKTKRTYTPFSHETLRQLLENKICALKPMDTVEEDKVLDYWLNFIMKNKIVIRGNDEDATYCIDSKICGDRLSDQLECRNQVLVLGKTRTEAYNTFHRYCGELIKEWKSYEKDIMKPFFPNNNADSKNVLQIYSCDYIANRELCQYDHKMIMELTKDDEDFIQLDKEMARLDKRATEYAEQLRNQQYNEQLSNCDANGLSEYCKKLKSSTNIE